ncbi:hypothetical protein ACFL27_12065 [candidate division CSSED10-310 bacterium]|uniref:Transcriptional regulator n=1 Tax=candidate division CSSED10-310 bacterium TaxID=2855610 RepID=A0ABV6YXX2_UNCC1
MIIEIRNKVEHEELDYNFLMDCLKDYRKPRDKLSLLINRGDLIRIKKGLYVFGEKIARSPYSREVLANLINGPSYVSLEYALNYWGMIPEKAHVVTSVTLGKSRKYQTPVGYFTYRHLARDRYWVGINLVGRDMGRSFLIATMEKALVDTIWSDKSLKLQGVVDMEQYLSEQLRIDEDVLSSLNNPRMEFICSCFHSAKINLLLQYLQQGILHE